jgi:hypothetical protein
LLGLDPVFVTLVIEGSKEFEEFKVFKEFPLHLQE